MKASHHRFYLFNCIHLLGSFKFCQLLLPDHNGDLCTAGDVTCTDFQFLFQDHNGDLCTAGDVTCTDLLLLFQDHNGDLCTAGDVTCTDLGFPAVGNGIS